MMKSLKIAGFQMDIVWNSPKENRAKVEQWVKTIDADVDLIIMPEMFSTGFGADPSTYAEEMDGETITWLRELSVRVQKAIICSVIIRAEDRAGKEGFYNRLFFVSPDNTILCYDKRHLFRMAGEHKLYKAGCSKKIIHYKGFRILPLICYDLRFPVWSRNRNNYDLLIYVANWPGARSSMWTALLKARAIENLCYTVGINCASSDPNIKYAGDSAILNYLGDVVVSGTPSKEDTLVHEFDMESLEEYRKKFPAMMDADKFDVYDD